MRTPSDVRRELEQQLHRKVEDLVWAFVVEMRNVEDVLDGAPLEELEAAVRKAEGLRAAPRTQRPLRTELPPDSRGEALSTILAIDAGRIEAVIQFRWRILKGRLIKPQSVASWIKRRAEREGEPTVWVRHPKGGKGPSETSVERLSYLSAEGEAEVVALTYGGDLWRLKLLADELCRAFPWQQAQAVSFILAGAVPLLVKARRTVEEARISVEEYGSYPALRRVWLELGPYLKSSEVAQLYSEAREEIFPERGQDRVLSSKHARLAVFSTRHNDGSRSWDEVMARWNTEYPEDAYKASSNFSRDARTAYERVTGANQDWKGKGRK